MQKEICQAGLGGPAGLSRPEGRSGRGVGRAGSNPLENLPATQSLGGPGPAGQRAEMTLRGLLLGGCQDLPTSSHFFFCLLRPPAKSEILYAKRPTRVQILIPPTQELWATLSTATDPTSGATTVTQASGSPSWLVARFIDHV